MSGGWRDSPPRAARHGPSSPPSACATRWTGASSTKTISSRSNPIRRAHPVSPATESSAAPSLDQRRRKPPPAFEALAVIAPRTPTFEYSSELLRWGGAEGNRTPDLFHAMEALYQLSYSPAKHGDPTSGPDDQKARCRPLEPAP